VPQLPGGVPKGYILRLLERLLLKMVPHQLGRHAPMTKKHLLPMIADKQKDPEETPRLKALIKWVIELHQAGLEACHHVEEIILRRICPLGR
jgi:hypothetical protein